MAPSRHDWKIVDWDVKPQHNNIVLRSDRVFLCTCLVSPKFDQKSRKLYLETELKYEMNQHATLSKSNFGN